MATLSGPRIQITEAPPQAGDNLAEDVRRGFTQAFKTLSPKHLYDARGCELFEEICTLEEYYPTRTERAILLSSAADIIARTGAAELVELGAGSATKTRVLLDAMADHRSLTRYVPFDIARAAVEPTCREILEEYPQLTRVHGVVGDFTRDLDLIPDPRPGEPRLIALLGSTIGNFIGAERADLLSGIRRRLGPTGHFLLGVDLVKDPAVLTAAYDDARGVTAAFNLNLLSVINRELGGDLPIENFDHVARYDPEQEWIEMRLRARAACVARLRALDLDVRFAAGEEMRTEISAKFTPARIRADLGAAGMTPAGLFTDPDARFALVLARAS